MVEVDIEPTLTFALDLRPKSWMGGGGVSEGAQIIGYNHLGEAKEGQKSVARR